MPPSKVLPPPLPAVHRVSSVDAAAVVLRDQILDGHLRPGSPLREADLSSQLGISRHTLRVALTNLAHEGIVNLEPNRGAFVRSLTAEDVRDCYRLRTILELQAVRGLSGNIAALAPAREAVGRLVGTPVDAAWSVSREADLTFHRTLVDGLGSARISRTYDSLLNELRLCLLLEDFPSKDQQANAGHHLRMLEVVESGDVEAAVALMTEHLEVSCEESIAALRTS
ncbi:GntR family transcriptional regulator [Paenarthrobacter nitroguajacolicus]|uniref:GntR family transcriptional regulator n=1 Tax=Paenarthrobacter nitroguajacolicus TaxID=211146 RepID=UPI002854213B|nr:GntR family transcriptional regulator [Paenarthrobacter nitroguajacolicus]MDR6639446.1 DNA-binding GntR family transcriptional regulator [Paenarthrobacter nitroguajacolicus]